MIPFKKNPPPPGLLRGSLFVVGFEGRFPHSAEIPPILPSFAIRYPELWLVFSVPQSVVLSLREHVQCDTKPGKHHGVSLSVITIRWQLARKT